MDEKRWINPYTPVYISYAWANDKCPHLEEGVDALCKLLEENNIFYKRDKTNLCPYRWSISKAEHEIGEGSAVIVVVSERYVKSLHCMHEWHLIRENGKLSNRVFPIVLQDANLTDKDVYMQYYDFFDKRKNELVEQQRENKIPLTEVESRASKHDYFIDDLKKLYQYLADHNHYFSPDNYATIIDQLKSHLNKSPIDISPSAPNTAPVADDPVTAKATPHFSLPIAEGLKPRDKEVENLFGLVSQNRIANLIGVGGSGKSSLTYLFLDAHKDAFNEIAYVVVNNSVKKDVVEQLNQTLRLELDAGEAPFTEVFSYLQKNYVSPKPNLLILDINEASAREANVQTVNEFIQDKSILNGWKILILSREGIDTRHRIKSHSLNDQEDIAFLRELFLDKAGARYRDFGAFEELFKVVCYNPLLTEQLGFYVKKYPRSLTIEEIKKILYGNSFQGQEMHGMSAQRHDETIITFLKNLIKYNELSYSEKELLRHFVLWQPDYISYAVVEDLLRGVFDSEDQLVNTLSSLSDRSILTVNSGPALSSYKLHGLLADSLREQIDLSKEEHFRYIYNISRIIGYDYYRFLPYVDCLANSFSEYDITDDFLILNLVGQKLLRCWKYEYCQKVLEKNIKRIENEIKDNEDDFLCNQLVWSYIIIAGAVNSQRAKSYLEKAIAIGKKLPKENPEYQNDLASAYNSLAILQKNHLGAYKSAEANYKQAIAIRENLPKGNPEYQHCLAITYSNLANLQQDHLGAYESAQANYKQAIAMTENLPKENPEYQYGLARSYNNLANLQQAHLGEYVSAEANYKQAIAIRENLPKENPEYQNDLADAYNNLALLQQDHLGAYESAEANYKQAIAIRENLPKDNPEYQNDLAGAYYNLALLQKAHLGAYESAEASYKQAIAIRENLPKENPEYQNGLAGAYNNLANLQQDHLGAYESAEANYKQAIAIREHLPKDNPEYQNGLASAYYNLAILQQAHLGAYKTAEANYKQAIAIREHLPKENPEYQNGLACSYYNLASLQQDHLEDYESAEANYKQAIAIREHLPKENPEYQNGLASSYNNLANLQQAHLGAYKSAEANYKQAIAIRENLPKENPEYQNGLASAYNGLAYCYDAQMRYDEAVTVVEKAIDIDKGLLEKDSKYLINWINHKHSLAEFVFNHHEVERAKAILDEIKPMADKCFAENPNDSWVQTVHNNVIELLQKCAKS